MKALIGAQGTGKTTLLKAFCEKHPEFVWSDGTSRPMKLIRERLGLSKHQYQEANNLMAFDRYEMNKKQSNYITTRTLIDNYIYSKLAGYRDLVEELDYALCNLDFRDIEYFYLPIEFGIEDDGVRSPDTSFQLQFDIEIFKAKHEFGFQITTLSGTVKERIKQLENYLEL